MKPLITVVREPEAQYVLIMETSSSLDDHGQWKWINKAAQKFIRYDLPVNSNLAIVTFSNSSEVQHSMVQVHNDDVRGMLADTIPDKYHLNRDKSGVKCLLCGIKKAIHEVLRSNMAGAHLILVTRGSQDTLSISDEQSIQEYIRYYHIKVSSILIPGSDKPPLAFFDSIAQLSGGLSHIVKEARHRTVKTYVALMDAFSALLRGQELMPRVIHKDVIQMNGYSSTTGSFTVDPSLGKNTKFGIFVEDEEDHLIKSITFTDSKGFLYGPYTSMSSVYDIINLKAINFPVGGSPPFDEVNELNH